MFSKLVKLGSLFVAGALAASGSVAHADNINTSGVLCQNFNASEALDIDYFTNAVRDINAAGRSIICSMPRSPLAAGAIPEFFVDGQNSPNTSTTCTVTTYSFLGTVTNSLTFTESATTVTRQWDHLVQFAANTVGTFDYASVLCFIPGSGQGLLFGVTSVQ